MNQNHRNHDPEKCPYCVGRDGEPKWAYRSEAEARDAASSILRRRRVSLRAYECEHTWKWHLTSDLSGGR